MRILGSALAFAIVAATSAAAQDAASAKAFVTRLYAAYHGQGPDYLSPPLAAKVFSPRLLGLIRRDARLAHGEVGALDGDPLCNCQDFEIRDVRVEVNPQAADRVGATVRFRNFGEPKVVRLDLLAVGGGWRVDNIHADGTPDLADFLRKHGGGR